jgi:glucose/arabinose dehydrogenase
LALLALAAPAAAVPTLTPVGSFDQPVYVSAPPGDGDRLFVVEKPGRIQVITKGGAPRVFLDITAEVDPVDEKGLLSMAFAPDYATSRRFYVFFTAADAALHPGSRLKVVEFLRSATDPDAADASARRTLLDIPHPVNSNHNGGQLQFGPDGLLYVSTGDGGGQLDPRDNAQDPDSLLGKLLRIDPSPSATRPYTIPVGNPWADGVGGAPEVFVYGLRNPWRFSFDRETGDLTVGDVGQSTREEIDFLASGTGAGTNFGWDCFEGTHDVSASPGCPPPSHVPPVFEYTKQPGQPCSAVTGGYVVRDPALPTLRGRYLYADLCLEKLRSIVLPAGSGDREEDLTVPSTVSFGEDSCGHVYVASIAGQVSRIDDEPFSPCPTTSPPVVGGGPEPGSSPTDPPPAPPAGPDSDPPGLAVSRAKHQRLVRNRAVYFAIRCDEPCSVATEANARLSVGGRTKKWAFRPLSASFVAGERPRLRLKLPKASRPGLAKRVARGDRPLVKIVVIVRDAAGNETRTTVYVRVVG